MVDIAAPAENLPDIPEPAGFGETFSASWADETIRTDAWNYAARKRRSLTEEMYHALPQDARDRIADRQWSPEPWGSFEAQVMGEIAAAVPRDPARWGQYPLDSQALTRRVDAERRAELDEAQATLDAPGSSGFAKFLGSSARAMTDETSIMLMPFGVSGAAWRTIAGEALLGGLGEAAVLPREFQVADDLGLQKPEIGSRIVTGMALSGGLAGVVLGGVHVAGRVLSRRRAAAEAAPAGIDEFDAEVAVDTAEARLLGDRTVQDVIGDRPPPGTLGAILPPTPGRAPETVPVQYELSGKIRNKPVAPAFLSQLRAAAAPLGDDIGVVIVSGGQDRIGTPGGRRTGSTRHDVDGQGFSSTADIVLTRNGIRVRPDEDKELYARFLYQAAGRFPGVGHYAWGVHVGGGSVAAWGPTTSARSLDPYFKEAIDAGRIGNSDWKPAPRVAGEAAPPPDFTGYRNPHGQTGTGQVVAGGEMRVPVEYEVADLSVLRPARGDLQPRDRSGDNSALQVRDIAAKLDPALLMPNPNAAFGTPVVGRDFGIDSGNGRVEALKIVYDTLPESAAAYRRQIEAAGFTIPEGIERPVLIARRTDDPTPADRQRFNELSQDSGVARMTPTEIAQINRQAMTPEVMGAFDLAKPFDAPENVGWARRVLEALPATERNALIAGKELNRTGKQLLREALFARAWSDPDIVKAFAETDAGELKSLIDALDQAAPSWAALKAEIEAGNVRPEMDISGHIMDAMRLIAAARTLAARDGLEMGKAVAELLGEVDMLEGAVAPLTAALVGKFWSGGRAARAADIASFLTRYAEDARKVGATAELIAGPGPREVLQAIDPKHFGDLPEDFGAARGYARPEPAPAEALPDAGFDAGATSPEAEALDALMAEALAAPEPSAALAELQAAFDGNPELQAALANMASRPLTTELPGYGSPEFWTNRVYKDAEGKNLLGREAAVAYLDRVARGLAWIEEGLPPGKIRTEQKATILIGPPASGKSTIANQLARDRGAMIVDADEAKKVIPEYAGGIGANAVHEESSELATDALAHAIASGDNVVVPKVGAKHGSIEVLTDQLKAAGYRVELVEVVATPATAIARMLGRFKSSGRLIPPEIMASGIDGAPKTYQILKEKGKADGYARIDNEPGRGEPRGFLEDTADIFAAFRGSDGADRAGAAAEPAGPHRGREGQAQGADRQDLTSSAADATALADEFGDLQFKLPDGSTVSARDILDDLQGDEAANAVIQSCGIAAGRAA